MILLSWILGTTLPCEVVPGRKMRHFHWWLQDWKLNRVRAIFCLRDPRCPTQARRREMPGQVFWKEFDTFQVFLWNAQQIRSCLLWWTKRGLPALRKRHVCIFRPVRTKGLKLDIGEGLVSLVRCPASQIKRLQISIVIALKSSWRWAWILESCGLPVLETWMRELSTAKVPNVLERARAYIR